MPWLSNNSLAKFCVIFIAIWAQIGWHATLYLAFLQAIPADLYEQATVDGANKWQQFAHITLPQLMPGIVTSTFLLMSGGLKVYDLPFTMTKGGPGYSTYTVTQSIIQQGIGQSQYGIGSALAVLFFIATGVVVFLQMGISDLILEEVRVNHGQQGFFRHGRAEGHELHDAQEDRFGGHQRGDDPDRAGMRGSAVVHPDEHVQDDSDMSANPLGLPKEWTIKNYINAFETVPVFRSLLNTLIVTFFAVVVEVLVGALAAYGMILRKSTFTAAVGAIRWSRSSCRRRRR